MAETIGERAANRMKRIVSSNMYKAKLADGTIANIIDDVIADVACERMVKDMDESRQGR